MVAAKDEALRDLRARVDAIEARLDASEAERRQLSERLHGLLTARTKTSSVTEEVSPAEPDFSRHKRGSAPPGEPEQITNSLEFAAPPDKTNASSGLAIPRPPWWRRWFR